MLKKCLRIPEVYLALLLALCVAVVGANKITVEDVELRRGDVAVDTSLPLSKKFNEGERFKVSFKIKNRFGNSFDLRIIPDDCARGLRVDDRSVPLSSRAGLCDYGRGFVLTHGELDSLGVKSGSLFVLDVENHGGDGGLNVSVENTGNALVAMMRILVIVLLLALTLVISRRIGTSWGLSLVLALGVALRVAFFMDLPKYDKFGHDVDGHVAYVHYIAENYSLPSDDECWTCYHPPVYFATSVPAFKVAPALGFANVEGLGAQSLVLSMMFLLIGFAFFRNFMSGGSLVVSTALLSFWPVLILAAPRIGNDQMFYVFHALCLWGGVRYLNSGRGKFLVLASVSTALAFWTKSTGVVTIGVLFLFAAMGYVKNAVSLKPKKSELVSWALFALMLVGIAIDKFVGDANLVGNSQSLHSGLKVGSTASNYLFFDVKTFMTEPYTSPWRDEMGRQYFWNYALKTSLFGEFILLKNATGTLLATLISGSFLGLVIYAVRGFWETRLKAIHWILLLQGVAFFAALASLRNKIPFSCSNDFRYIVPVLLSVIPFVAMGINLEKASLKWKVLGYGLVAVFVVSSAVLYILVQ